MSQLLMARRDALLHCAYVALVTVACVGLLTAAALTPAPAIVQPFIVVTCVGFAMLVASEVPGSLAVLRATRGSTELVALRRQLDELPETEHPLGL
jgi:hypothetical protein